MYVISLRATYVCSFKEIFHIKPCPFVSHWDFSTHSTLELIHRHGMSLAPSLGSSRRVLTSNVPHIQGSFIQEFSISHDSSWLTISQVRQFFVFLLLDTSTMRTHYTDKEVDFLYFYHCLSLLGRLLCYKNGRALFPVHLSDAVTGKADFPSISPTYLISVDIKRHIVILYKNCVVTTLM